MLDSLDGLKGVRYNGAPSRGKIGDPTSVVASKSSRASPDTDKIPDYYKIYAERDKKSSTGG